MLRTIYFGSSDFSLPGLRACLDSPGFEIVTVVTTPPQRQGRGLTLTPTVVARFCAESNIPYFEFSKLDANAFKQIAALEPEVFVVASYGKIIPESFLKLAQFRFNIHPSLLPKYRGASPLSGPILAGDAVTGLSIADITKDLDAGDIYYQETVPLSPSSDAEMLGVALAEKSYMALRDLLEKARIGRVEGTPQNSNEASYAPKLVKEDGRLFLNAPAVMWDRLVRGLKPWPGAFTEFHSERLGLLSVRIKKVEVPSMIGTILDINEDSLTIQTAEDAVELIQVIPAGKKGMSGGDYARGRRWQIGMRLK